MSPDQRIGRASDIIGRTVLDADGRALGQVADLVVDDAHRVVAAYVIRRPWGRLLGYERDEAGGPWVLEQLARRIWRRDASEIAWADLRLESP
jgi:sporulation protein YlmC with PRC-barrel domain